MSPLVHDLIIGFGAIAAFRLFSHGRRVKNIESHRELIAEANSVRTKYNDLLVKYAKLMRERNALVKQLNLMRHAEHKVYGSSSFTKDELKIMISLCHPDKHSNDAKAGAVTAKLLEVRDGS